MNKLSYAQTHNLIYSIVGLDSADKRELGRRFAKRLGFEPGPSGPDDGIDGEFYCDDKLCYFQSKLSRYPLDKDEARKFYSDVKVHDAYWSIMLAGVGYKPTFYERLEKHKDLKLDNVHLLTLEDLFLCSDNFSRALQDVPALFQLNNIDWGSYK